MVRRFLGGFSTQVRRRSNFCQSFFDRQCGDLRSRGKAHLSQDIAHVYFDGPLVHHQEKKAVSCGRGFDLSHQA